MKQGVTVLDENNMKLGETYRRRAAGLVEKERAVWFDTGRTVIRLVSEQAKEDPKLESTGYLGNGPREPETRTEPRYAAFSKTARFEMPADISGITDEFLYEAAKQRLNDRFLLIMNWAVFVFAQIVIWPVAAWMGGFFEHLTVFCACVFLFATLLHTVYYFVRVTPAKVLKEYQKLARKARS